MDPTQLQLSFNSMKNIVIKETLNYHQILKLFSMHETILCENENGSTSLLSKIHGKKEKKKEKWSRIEIEALIEGIQIFGIGKWSSIRHCFHGIFDENKRSSIDLSKKWEDLKKNAKYQRIEI